MTFKTQTVWAVPERDFLANTTFLLYNKISQMRREGKVANDAKRTVQSFPKFITEREWTSHEAAEEWIKYVTELGAESATIVDNSDN